MWLYPHISHSHVPLLSLRSWLPCHLPPHPRWPAVGNADLIPINYEWALLALGFQVYYLSSGFLHSEWCPQNPPRFMVSTACCLAHRWVWTRQFVCSVNSRPACRPSAVPTSLKTCLRVSAINSHTDGPSETTEPFSNLLMPFNNCLRIYWLIYLLTYLFSPVKSQLQFQGQKALTQNFSNSTL